MLHITRTLCVGLFVLMLAVPAWADEAGAPTQTMRKAMDQVLSILQDPDFLIPEKKQVLKNQLDPIVRSVFDFEELSRRAVGMQWRKFTPDQRTRFSNAFTELLAQTYVGRLQEYSGQEIKYTSERANSRGNVEVKTLLIDKSLEIPMDYRMIEKEAGWKVYDVIIEGVSLVKNYRTQFQEILINESPDELIAKVEKTAEQKRSAN